MDKIVKHTVDAQYKQKAVNEFLTFEKCVLIEIHHRLKEFFGHETLDVVMRINRLFQLID